MSQGVVSSLLSGGIAGAVTGAVLGGLISFLLERRREHRADRKVLAGRKDAEDFLAKLPRFQENVDELKRHLNKLGVYRVQRIASVLKHLELVSFTSTIGTLGSGEYSINVGTRFDRFSARDIKGAIEDVQNGAYDELLGKRRGETGTSGS